MAGTNPGVHWRGMEKSARLQPAAGGDAIRRYLADRDHPCSVCGHNLRGATGAVCPECGAVIRIGEAMPTTLPDDAFAFGLAGLLLFVLFSGLTIATGMPVTGVLCAAVAVAASFAWVRHGRWVRSRPRGGRVLLAVLCWSWPILLVSAGSLVEAARELFRGK